MLELGLASCCHHLDHPIGQLCCRLARHFGAGHVWLSEPSAGRRSYAEASRVDRAFDPSVAAAALEGLKADVVLESSGSEPGFRSPLAGARPEATIVVVGGGRVGLDPLTILVKELRGQGCVLVREADGWRFAKRSYHYRFLDQSPFGGGAYPVT